MANKDIHNKDLKQNPFQVPEHYFSDLKAEVMQNTVSDSPKVIRLNQNWQRIAAAAVLIISLVGGWLLFDQQQTSESDLLAAGVESELYSYDIDMLQYYSEEGMESELTDEYDTYLIQGGYADEELLYEND